jgi:hypothetical protein
MGLNILDKVKKIQEEYITNCKYAVTKFKNDVHALYEALQEEVSE